MKKIILSTILCLIIACNVFTCEAAELNHYEIAPVEVFKMPITVNGKTVAKEFYVDGNTLMLPLRAIAEALDYSIEWDEKLGYVTILKDEDSFKLRVSQTEYEKNDEIAHMENPLTLYTEKGFAPAKFFEQSMSLSVLFSDRGVNIIMKIAPQKPAAERIAPEKTTPPEN